VMALMSCTSGEEGYSGIIKDVTERTRLMEQVTRSQKMDSIGRLASSAAHDFNNFLGIILPTAELIKAEVDASPAVAAHANTIVDTSRRAAQLTQQLLCLSRTDAVSLRRIDLNEVVRATGKLIEEILHRDVRFEFDLTSEPLHIKADETQMQ